MNLKSKYSKGLALFLVFNLLFQLVVPSMAWALGGPSQPEVQSFEPIGTSEMVDLFSGDFNYNIPLLDVDGYPVNLSYHSGITMDQEASWVGLGWNINPGAITRNMRGLPDDFNGDLVKKEFNILSNTTFGAVVGVGGEIAGFQPLNLGVAIGINYNTYNGFGVEEMLNASLSLGKGGKGPLNAGLGLKSSSTGDLDVSPSLSFSSKISDKGGSDIKGGLSIGTSFNSRHGLKSLSISAHVSGVGATSIHGGSTLSFGVQTYVPSINMPMKNKAATLSVKLGGTFVAFDGTLDITGYVSDQRLARSQESVPAYGYLNAQNGKQDEALLDFNREKDGEFSVNTPALPVTNFTYDLFTVSGQGVGGMFRPYRSDIGYVFDKRVGTVSDNLTLALELKGGNLAQGGGEINYTDVNSVAGKWEFQNPAAKSLQFRGSTDSPFYEPYCFKEAGEKSVDADEMYDDIFKDDPFQIALKNVGGLEVATANTFDSKNSGSKTINHTYRNTPGSNPRQKRNQAMTFMSKKEALNFGLQKDLYVHTDTKELLSPLAKDHHLTEVTTLRSDGKRYIYGLPAYNTRQKEVSFNISDVMPDCALGLVPYDPANGDNSISNKHGNDHYFSSTELPAYAHSYLLTAVVSSDYVDIDNITGPSKGDLGTYTKFNYTRILDFNWRVPIEENKANFDEGLKTLDADNKGNYVYGTKDLFYLTSIETKNYVAKFDVDFLRKDAFEVAGENGGRGKRAMGKLNKITLFSSMDLEHAQKDPKYTAVPIKEIHFEYDYSLCPNLPANSEEGVDVDGNPISKGDAKNVNAAKGKLTLKKLYFTYESSKKAQLSPYTFSYADPDHVGAIKNGYNPSYNLKGYDRWGNFKLNSASSVLYPCSSGDALPTSEYPYVEQEQSTADMNTAAWSLSTIGLPSGGKINVNYESDDYAYVQDRRAMQMFKITGVGQDSSRTPSDVSKLQKGGKNYLFFRLKESVANKTDLYNNYLKGISDLYFRVLINVNIKGEEYVSGYGQIDNYGVVNQENEGSYGWIRLKEYTIKSLFPDENIPAISGAAVKFARLYTPQLAFPTVPFEPKGTVEAYDVIRSLANANLVKNVIDGFKNPDLLLYRDRKFGQDLVVNKSWLRLLNPNKKKLGGGLRVKSIFLSDEWGSMVGNAASNAPTFSYGQQYTYDLPDPEKPGLMMSSGVASYEPMVGADENPFRTPVFSGDQKDLLAPDSRFYQEEPYGESFFPSPGVGYSKVTVQNVYPKGTKAENIKKHAAGTVVHEFYTAKDYPIIVDRTSLNRMKKKSDLLDQLLSLDVRDYMTASQGFSVVLNDMHGKPKSQWVYAQGQTAPISGIDYYYKDNGSVLPNGARLRGNQLVNTFPVIDKKGQVATGSIGIDYDVVADMREQETVTESIGLQLNLYGFFVFIVPIVIPPIWPTSSKETTRFRSASITKVVNHYGILDETVAYDLGSVVSTKDVAFDAETGEVLLTKTKNEFKDEIYSFTYPAHWAQDGMGGAYQNVGLSIKLDQTGQIPNAPLYFVPGDEISYGVPSKGWVKEVSANSITVMDSLGNLISLPSSGTVKILRSGRRNMQSLSAGTLTCMRNPIDPDGDGKFNTDAFTAMNQASQIISASSIEYSQDVWKTFCDCRLDRGLKGGDPTGKNFNPYLLGLLGNWRPKKSYLYLTDRIQDYYNKNSNIRKDGPFTSFIPYWIPDSKIAGGNWTPSTEPRWTWTSEITSFSPFGHELENQDALHRYSAALYGYNNSLPTAVSSNSKYQQIGFDNFEDYNGFGDCMEDHFSFKTSRTHQTDAFYHTGKHSIKVGPRETIGISKPLKRCP